MRSEVLQNIKPHEIPKKAPWLGGKFYYSVAQRKQLDREGHDRMFFQTPDGSMVREYTELIDFDMLKENPDIQPMYPDAEFLGWGFFHSWK